MMRSLLRNQQPVFYKLARLATLSPTASCRDMCFLVRRLKV